MQPRQTQLRSLKRYEERGTTSDMSWAELCCCGWTCLQLLWPRVVLHKWLNISSMDSDFSADIDTDDTSNRYAQTFLDAQDNLPRLRRQNSEILRAQYIQTKEIRVCVGTWNVGGELPPDDLDIEEWININDPADIYVLGLQEIVPLNVGNIFGAEDNQPIMQWENVIRRTLRSVPANTSNKSYSDPPSPSKFKPVEYFSDVEDELSLCSDSEGEEEVHPVDEEPTVDCKFRDKLASSEGTLKVPEVSDGEETPFLAIHSEKGLKNEFSTLTRLESRLKNVGNKSAIPATSNLNRAHSGTKRISLSCPKPPLDLLAQHVLERPFSFKSAKSYKMSKSYKAYKSFKIAGDHRALSGASMLAELDLEALVQQRRRPEYVRIASKQMVGIFLTIWVRKSLCKHIQNLKVSTVGVGAMGYIGNKGAVSISMSIYQTLFCFICTHLTSGERECDQIKRNADVNEIHRRTSFHSDSVLGVPKSIYDHERIIWFGDLNYRINLSYDETRQLIFQKEWSKLLKFDQLVKELEKDRIFDGWSEGTLSFPPTYKYEMNSDTYYGEDPKAGRRTPAWCDRILSFGKGLKQLNYRRSEIKLSDHRPVTAMYDVEVEVSCPQKLRRALTFTDAEWKMKRL